MKYLFLIGCFMLTGCDKLFPYPFKATGTGELVVVGVGQSNMTGVLQQNEFAVTVPYGRKTGPGYIFAKTLNRPTTFIECGEPGSFMNRWIPEGDLYQRCLNRIGSAKPDVIVFYQGESDAESDHPEPWAEEFTHYVLAMRRLYPDIPVLFAQIHSLPPEFPFASWIKQQQTQVVLPRVKMVWTDDLPTHPDGVHLTDQAYITLGERMAAIYQNGF